jgi:hypothetical protein
MTVNLVQTVVLPVELAALEAPVALAQRGVMV